MIENIDAQGKELNQVGEEGVSKTKKKGLRLPEIGQ
jgi:hypothetical protein